MQVELKAIQQQVGITFIFVTHDQQEALTMSDRIAVFADGRIEQVGTPDRDLRTPGHAVRRRIRRHLERAGAGRGARARRSRRRRARSGPSTSASSPPARRRARTRCTPRRPCATCSTSARSCGCAPRPTTARGSWSTCRARPASAPMSCRGRRCTLVVARGARARRRRRQFDEHRERQHETCEPARRPGSRAGSRCRRVREQQQEQLVERDHDGARGPADHRRRRRARSRSSPGRATPRTARTTRRSTGSSRSRPRPAARRR